MRLSSSPARLALAAALAALLSSSSHYVEAYRIQAPNLKAQPERAEQIRQSFRSSFSDYLKYASGADELLPLSKGKAQGFGAWGATYIDALSTAKVMGFEDLFQQGIAFALKVDFTKTSQTPISLFETNIRYLASLISIYELDGKRNAALLKQAQAVGDRLLQGWEGNNDIPYNSLQWGKGPASRGNAIIAEAGTLLLEFDRLSKYTRNPTYLDHARRAMLAVFQKSQQTLPKGLYGQGIDPVTSKATNDYMTWGGGSDSAFEYLPKYAQLVGTSGPWLPLWGDIIKASSRYLVTKPGATRAQDLAFLSDYAPSAGGQIPRFSHLGCFAGGNWILGGRLVGNEAVVQAGVQLARSCIATYQRSASGIGPESFVFKSANGGANGVTISNNDFYSANGFDYDSPAYILRPEVVESVFYAYRATGDVAFQDASWQAFQNIVKHCKAPAALASLDNVNATNPRQIDDSESFLYAETYKYLYLAQVGGDVLPLEKYVFNTEAHPFEVESATRNFAGEAILTGELPAAEVGTPTTPAAAAATASGTRQGVPTPVYSNLPTAALGAVADVAAALRRRGEAMWSGVAARARG